MCVAVCVWPSAAWHVCGPLCVTLSRLTRVWLMCVVRSRLTRDVKLVGAAISCEGSPYKGDVDSTWRRNPHVQSYALATDR